MESYVSLPELAGEEYVLTRATARRFFEEEVAPHYAGWEKRGYVDRELWQKAGSQGLLCTMVPEEYGGIGGNFLHAMIVVEELARSECALPGFFTHSDIIVPYIARLGTDAQKKQWLPGCVSGEVITSIAITEPGAGSDMKGVRLRARKDGDDWILNGQKTFITNGWLADLIIVVANTSPDTGSKSKSLFLVDTKTKGFERGRLLEKVGQKAQDTAELFFDDVRVPGDAMLGEEGMGLKYLMQELPVERLLVGVWAQAVAETVFERTSDYVYERKVFGQSVGDFQSTKFTLADIRTELEVGRSFLNDCASRVVQGKLTSEVASMAKIWLSEMQGRVIDRCLQLFGGYGYMWEYPVARAFADARAQRIYGGTNEIMKEIISRGIQQRHAK
ncbi:acyl-CoA dehydrogenase family protein [uncultured Sneathiella sp.]|uniref:acyl-CoA dehydrogenase family protein n=1 Tax=uncultured Sneathiella sp. TaxID=879315 RepID=UPI0030ED2D41|tara:strand:- start:40234 stop:41400 length:1167 start_codon:yes stop_codon:yes gene_type:complete